MIYFLSFLLILCIIYCTILYSSIREGQVEEKELIRNNQKLTDHNIELNAAVDSVKKWGIDREKELADHITSLNPFSNRKPPQNHAFAKEE